MPHSFSFDFSCEIVTGSGTSPMKKKTFSHSEQKIRAQMMLWSLLVRSRLPQQTAPVMQLVTKEA